MTDQLKETRMLRVGVSIVVLAGCGRDTLDAFISSRLLTLNVRTVRARVAPLTIRRRQRFPSGAAAHVGETLAFRGASARVPGFL
jgi:hypothetical protein